MILGDEVYQELGFEEEQIEQARMKYQSQVRHELEACQRIIMPFMRQLSSGNPFAAAMGGFDPMGGMGNIDPSMLANIDPAAM